MNGDKRPERVFHDAIWGVANDWMRCERAIVEARDLAYTVLSDDFDGDDRKFIADQWLRNHGRDSLQERLHPPADVRSES